ncbi:hypothetical protein BVY11_28480 [Pseudomonas amygdali pv. morsprunorum]|uniref:hypothetical protein n=1 Tax=Pseudomonas amygdali TaxID=47877 RepID=UPI0006B8808A|nr:hypothetical protein [Pseudomonas amygdali]PPS23964.1 hypothetical protein BVY11_28480 [Pseudomonas amygdali pv. morsprunorum]KPB57247.1 Uncharacterized protein AC510_4552 [Pseudomonas amygdali pv. myricae]KPX94128.1 Uncharacterized protein ALO62_01664 [Pseudomonas amygdali pv. myricae]KWS44780.1 hypothetical protein AL057_09810 [Pseudomonas amygdali pv. myricae]PPS28811.1 hypothetical protein BVY12_24265 [Pseudomonas amygdali pv. morsprunorum]
MKRTPKTQAQHSKDYRDRKKAEAERLGIEKVSISLASGVKAGMSAAMKRNGINSPQEAWQNLGLYFMRASPADQDRMLGTDASDPRLPN